MGEASDAELMRSWQRGDADIAQSAFAELVRRWQQSVARFLGRMTGRPELVPDLCQEVFLHVCRGASTYRQEGQFSTWLYRIAINVAHDAGRRLRIRPDQRTGNKDQESGAGSRESGVGRNGTGADVPSLIPDARSPLPEVACERRELAEAVSAALAELPEEQRLPLILRHYEGLNFEEIARLTGSPASTIKSRFAAALRRLKTRLEQQGWGPREVSE